RPRRCGTSRQPARSPHRYRASLAAASARPHFVWAWDSFWSAQRVYLRWNPFRRATVNPFPLLTPRCIVANLTCLRGPPAHVAHPCPAPAHPIRRPGRGVLLGRSCLAPSSPGGGGWGGREKRAGVMRVLGGGICSKVSASRAIRQPSWKRPCCRSVRRV